MLFYSMVEGFEGQLVDANQNQGDDEERENYEVDQHERLAV
jgi:hypothetical protein